MHAVVRELFGRLHELDPNIEEAKLTVIDPESDENELRMNVQTTEALAPDPVVEGPSTPTPEEKTLPHEESRDDTNAAEGDSSPTAQTRSECRWQL